MDAEARRTRVRGEVVAFGKLFAALTTLKRRDRVSEHDVAVYEDRTAHIPIHVLALAVTRWLDTREWFPVVAELLAMCEVIRREMRAAVVFIPCENCSSQGWAEVERDGIKRAVRCGCWVRHQQKVQELGAGRVPLALPAPEVSRIGE